MLDYRDRGGLKKQNVREIVKYLEDTDIKKQYLETLKRFGLVEQEVYPVEIISQEKLGWYFEGLKKFWESKGAVIRTSYRKEHGLKEEYVLKIRVYYS